MNKASEMKSAAARLEVERRLDLQKKAEAAVRAEKDEEHQLEILKMERLRGLRLAREAALRKIVPATRASRARKRS